MKILLSRFYILGYGMLFTMLFSPVSHLSDKDGNGYFASCLAL